MFRGRHLDDGDVGAGSGATPCVLCPPSRPVVSPRWTRQGTHRCHGTGFFCYDMVGIHREHAAGLLHRAGGSRLVLLEFVASQRV